LSRLSPAFVLGYHGCDNEIAERILGGKDTVRQSKNDYDWLGAGSYFWEGDPERAMIWAKEHKRSGKIKAPAVVGAVINLGNCLNLSTQEGVALLKDAYNSYCAIRKANGEPLAINNDPVSGGNGDKLMRRLDNAVIETLHSIMLADNQFTPFDTVRGMFREGKSAYRGAGFWENTHVQIAVRNQDSIIGYFRPRKRRK
jgi:hypothetical protein